MCTKIAGHIGVHVPETVQCAQGQVQDEAPNDGKDAPHLTVFHLVHQHVDCGGGMSSYTMSARMQTHERSRTRIKVLHILFYHRSTVQKCRCIYIIAV